MQTQKRLWIYSGLAVPEGIGLVRRQAHQAVAPRRVLLVGDSSARGLVLPMTQLAMASNSALHVDIDPGASARDWAKNDKLVAHLAVFRPNVVFLVLDPADMLARRCIRARVAAAGARAFWMVPPGVSSPPRTRFITSSEPNATGLATWAARAWTMVT